MSAQVDAVVPGFGDTANQSNCKRLGQHIEESGKLQYKKEIVEEAVATHQVSVLDALIAIFDCAIKKAFPEVKSISVAITPSTNPKFGDYQCNNALTLARELSPILNKISPHVVSTKICVHLDKGSVIDHVEIAGPGFINIFISRKFVENEITKLVRLGFHVAPTSRPLTCIVDMSSPNIAKEMHVGHLRSTIIGDCVARILAFRGHNVIKINHLGDWGTQFGMLIAHLKDTFGDLGDKALPVSDLQKFYKEAKKRFDSEEDFKKRSYEAVVKLQSHDPEHIRDWRKICDVSMKEFNEIYRRMDIENLIQKGESFYQSRMIDVVKYLEEHKLLENDDGRRIMWTPASDVPLIIVKSDGGFTYDTSDMATIRYRIDEQHGERLIYVTDAGQATHFKAIYSAAEICGFADPSHQILEHVPFGMVLGEDRKKFKTRSGDTVKLVSLLDEGVERVRKKLIEKGRDKELTEEEQQIAAEAVAYGCIKYADLSHNRVNDYIFSFDKMLDDRGNTAAYLLYAYTRIQSIIRKTGWSEEKLTEVRKSFHTDLEHPTELKLGKALCRLPEILIRLEQDLYFHKLCEYLYNLSCAFTEFYDSCYCIEREKGNSVKIYESRILLCDATAKVMKCCFDILGIRTVEKM
ncbi:hypothetical protein Aperf_G00000108497 [Anoplocephala perfoliata]